MPGVDVLELGGRGQQLRVERGAGADEQVAGRQLLGDLGGRVHGRLRDPGDGAVGLAPIAGVVDLAATRVQRDADGDRTPRGGHLGEGLVREGVQGAQAVQRHAEHGGDRAGGDEAHAQPGEGARPPADDHAAQLLARDAGGLQGLLDQGQQHLVVVTGAGVGADGEDLERGGARWSGPVGPRGPRGQLTTGDGDAHRAGGVDSQQHQRSPSGSVVVSAEAGAA